MLILDSLLLLRRYSRGWSLLNKTIALVPAHSNLHQGHLQLLAEARRNADIIVLALLPGAAIETDQHDSCLQQDCELLTCSATEKADINLVDILFIPSQHSLYPDYPTVRTSIHPLPVATALEPQYAPARFGFFATTLCKLLNLLQPDILCVGEKNYQQLLVIKQLIQDLDYPVQMMTTTIARESNGLPYSRSLASLTAEQKQALRPLKQQLDWIARQLEYGERLFGPLIKQCGETLIAANLEPVQVQILDADNLREVTVESQRVVILLAITLDGKRFSDNLVIGLRN